jgi:hypothetical protein
MFTAIFALAIVLAGGLYLGRISSALGLLLSTPLLWVLILLAATKFYGVSSKLELTILVVGISFSFHAAYVAGVALSLRARRHSEIRRGPPSSML